MQTISPSSGFDNKFSLLVRRHTSMLSLHSVLLSVKLFFISFCLFLFVQYWYPFSPFLIYEMSLSVTPLFCKKSFPVPEKYPFLSISLCGKSFPVPRNILFCPEICISVPTFCKISFPFPTKYHFLSYLFSENLSLSPEIFILFAGYLFLSISLCQKKSLSRKISLSAQSFL